MAGEGAELVQRRPPADDEQQVVDDERHACGPGAGRGDAVRRRRTLATNAPDEEHPAGTAATVHGSSWSPPRLASRSHSTTRPTAPTTCQTRQRRSPIASATRRCSPEPDAVTTTSPLRSPGWSHGRPVEPGPGPGSGPRSRRGRPRRPIPGPRKRMPGSAARTPTAVSEQILAWKSSIVRSPLMTAVTAPSITSSNFGQSPAHSGPSAVGESARPLMNAWLFSGGVKPRKASMAASLLRLGMLAPELADLGLGLGGGERLRRAPTPPPGARCWRSPRRRPRTASCPACHRGPWAAATTSQLKPASARAPGVAQRPLMNMPTVPAFHGGSPSSPNGTARPPS